MIRFQILKINQGWPFKMMTLSESDLKSIEFLDKLHTILDSENLVNQEKVIDRLKGTMQESGIISKLIAENQMLRSEIYGLQNDVAALSRILNRIMSVTNTLSNEHYILNKYGT